MSSQSNSSHQGYFAQTVRRATKATWDWVFANHPWTVGIGLVGACLAIFLQRTYGQQSTEQMREAFISIGFGLASYAVLFAFVFLVHFCYLIPKRNFAALVSQLAKEDSAKDKGLTVSIGDPRIDELAIAGPINQRFGQLKARLIFTNNGHASRAILGVEFVYRDPEKILKGRQLFSAPNIAKPLASFVPRLVDPNGTEVIVNCQDEADINLCEKPGAEFGISITVTDGKGGHSRNKNIMMLTITQEDSKGPRINYLAKSLSHISLDHD